MVRLYVSRLQRHLFETTLKRLRWKVFDGWNLVGTTRKSTSCYYISRAGDKLTDGRAEDTEEALPALPCLSWLWLEVGRLPWRLELEGGRSS